MDQTSETDDMPDSPPRLVRQKAICREIPRPVVSKYPPSTPPLPDLPADDLALAIDRALDYMWKRRACCPDEQPNEKIKIKIEKDTYRGKLERKRRFSKASIVFSGSRDKSKRQKRYPRDKPNGDNDQVL